MNKSEAIKMWTYRRVVIIPWTNYVINKQVFDHFNQERELLHTIEVYKTSYPEHFLRALKYFLPQLIVQRKIEWKRGIRRRHLADLKHEELIRRAKDHETFSEVIVNIHRLDKYIWYLPYLKTKRFLTSYFGSSWVPA